MKRSATVLLLLLSAAPVSAQQEEGGQVATSSSGQVGRRLERGRDMTGTEALGRIESRIPNRVQNRLRNRIDQYYDPAANALSPFDVASDRARTAGQRLRR